MNLTRCGVPTWQVGALLGKGGATITQVRKESGATVRLLPLEAEDERLLPREIASVASHKLLQFEGPITAILKALRTVCRLLRGCQVCNLTLHSLLLQRSTPWILAYSAPGTEKCRASGTKV